jgi:hypothetical protein
MTAIRDCRALDHDEIVELSLRAWAPVFMSVGEVLGRELSTLLHGADWREHQAGEVELPCTTPRNASGSPRTTAASSASWRQA